MLLGKVDFSNLFIALDGNSYNTIADLEKAGAPAIKIGLFVNDSISFLILGTVMFMLVKSYNKLRAKEEVVPAPPSEKTCNDCAMSIPVAAKICPYCGNKEV
jgi:large conductance mechanosensitive channel